MVSPAALHNPFDRLHAWAVNQRSLRMLTGITRVLLALAFVPSGLVKIMGTPFTTLPTTDPVGLFFAGFFSAHGYYRFVGIAQWTAGALLLIPQTAVVGAALYLPIVVNIFAINVAVDFGGTRVISGLMLLADLYLLCWDYDRWKGLLPGIGASRSEVRARHVGLFTTLALGLAAGIGFWGVTGVHLGRIRHQPYTVPLIAVGAGAVLGLAALVSAWRASQTPHPD